MSKKRASQKRALLVHKKPYKTDFLYRVLVAVFGGLKSISKEEAFLALDSFAKEKRWPRDKNIEVMEYLLKRKFCRSVGEKFLIVQTKFKSLCEQQKYFVKPEPRKEFSENLKLQREQKKQNKKARAKVPFFDESVMTILSVIFSNNLKAEFSLGSMQRWVFDLMSTEWYCVKSYKPFKPSKSFEKRKPTQKQALGLLEKMKRVGLVAETHYDSGVYASLTHKGAVYCGLENEDTIPNRLSKNEKFSKNLAALGCGDMIPKRVRGLRSLKKEIRRAEASL